MGGDKRSPSDSQELASASRQPVFNSQRFSSQRLERGSSLGHNPRADSSYTTDEAISKLLKTPSQIEHLGSQRRSSVSETIARELALAEASFNPTDLLREGLDEWHDKSLSIQLLKRNQSETASRKRALRNPSQTSARFPEGFLQQGRLSDSSLFFPSIGGGSRHRLNFEYKHPDLETNPIDGSSLELSKDYTASLTAAPPATLIHVVMLYHHALLKNGLKDEAQKIADHLSQLESADLEEMALELSGIDLLLRDGLLKYLMTIQPYIPTIPSQVVRFKNVGFTGTVRLDTGYESIYTKGLETLKGPFKKSPLQQVTLLRELTGYFMPGTLTLIMGTPGSGIPVINSVLSGRSSGPGNSTSGLITYNGKNVHDIKSRRLISLVGSNDAHYAFLSVRETLEFARECSQYYKTNDYRPELKELVENVLKAGQDPKLETNLSMMGLKRVAERPVGSPMRPSITEAERHRLSVAEMVAGTYAVYMFDQLNKGLDDTVAFDLVTSIRIFTRVRATTAVASLIQPSQGIFDLFDRVILLDQGQVVYQGPCQDALPYFEILGYVKPRQVSVPEFLEEVTTSDGAKYLQPGFPSLTVEGFANAYKDSDSYKDVCRVVDSPEVVEEIWVQGSQPLGVNFEQNHENQNKGQDIEGPGKTIVSSVNEKGGSLVEVSMNHTGVIQEGDEVVAIGGPTGMLNYLKIGDSAKDGALLLDQSREPVRLQLERPLMDEKVYDAQFSREYVLNAWPEFLLLLRRDLSTTWRNKLGLIIRAVQVFVLGFYVGVTFFRVHTDAQQLNMNLLRSVFFVSLLDMTLFNLGQLPFLLEERQIFYKQQGANFFRPSSYLFAKIVGSLPFALAEATTWTIIVYFLSNLSVKDGGWHFWVFYVVIVLSVLNGAAMVRFISSLAPDIVAANGMIGIIVAIFIVFAGFLIPRFEVRHYWLWAYYLDPLQWGITALVINEFTAKNYDVLCSEVPNIRTNLPQCNNRLDETIGHAYLARGQFYTGRHWIAIAIVALIGWFILWTLLTYLALAKIRHIPMAIITPGAEAKFLRKSQPVSERDVEDQGVMLNLSLVANPVTLSWHELSYDILIPSIGRTLNILSYVSGWAEPGEMVALLGATGTGKTTLLNCLAGRGVDFGRIGGEILVNGFPKVQESFTRVMGYVDKLEAYSPYMTVREAIAFNCELQAAKTATINKRHAFVEEILDLMELRIVENTLVKSLGHHYLTLAEATRLRVATELARNPSIIFMDTPTKNLDSRSALHLVRVMKRIADSGRIVICAIPLPTQRILTCFTSVQILKRGGETVYWGPVGKDGEFIQSYFESIPGTPACPPNTSITTYAVDVIGDGVVDRKALKDYAFEYRVNDLALHNHIQLQRLRKAKGNLGPEVLDTGFGSSYGTRALNVFKKLQLYYWRNVAYSWGRLVSSVITALLLGSIFFHQKSDTTPGMNTKAGAIFISTLLQAISNAQSVIPQVITNRVAYAREQSSRQFNLLLYLISWASGEVLYLAVATLIYSGIFLGMVKMAVDSAAHFFLYWFILFCLTLAITFFGIFIASVAVLPQIAGTLVTIFVGFWVATSGVVVPRMKVLPEFIWIFWTNPLQYALSALTSISFYCDVDKQECLNGGLNLNCATDPSACPLCECQRLKDAGFAFVWSTIKKNRSLNHDFIPYDILALLLFAVLFRLLTFLVWRLRDGLRMKHA